MAQTLDRSENRATGLKTREPASDLFLREKFLLEVVKPSGTRAEAIWKFNPVIFPSELEEEAYHGVKIRVDEKAHGTGNIAYDITTFKNSFWVGFLIPWKNEAKQHYTIVFIHRSMVDMHFPFTGPRTHRLVDLPGWNTHPLTKTQEAASAKQRATEHEKNKQMKAKARLAAGVFFEEDAGEDDSFSEEPELSVFRIEGE